MTEEVIRPCGLPHHGLRTPTLSNTHQFLCWPANGGSTLWRLSGQITSGSNPFKSVRKCNLWSGFGLFLSPSFLCSFLLSSNDRAAASRHKGTSPCSGLLNSPGATGQPVFGQSAAAQGADVSYVDGPCGEGG
jgi:hypothetical protein